MLFLNDKTIEIIRARTDNEKRRRIALRTDYFRPFLFVSRIKVKRYRSLKYLDERSSRVENLMGRKF